MAFTVEAGKLSAALAEAARVAPRNSPMHIVNHVAMRNAGGRLTVEATDLDMSVTVEVPSEGDDAEFTVNADRAHQIARGFDGDVTIDVGERATFKSGRSRFALPVLPIGDFPEAETDEGAVAFSLPSVDLRALLVPRYAASTEPARQYLCGVYWHVVNSDLVATATNGHILAKRSVKSPVEAFAPAIIPTRACDALARMADGGDAISITLSERKIGFAAAGIRYVSKLVDGTFPDYERVIPRDNKNIAKVDRAAMIAACRHIKPMSDRGWRGAVFNFSADKPLGIEVKNPESGDANREMDCVYDGDGLSIAFDVDYVIDTLSNFDTDEVEIALGGPGDTAVLTAPNALAVIMPRRA